jgi:predicted AlkP superfamily pyrophosphatase or phosphodiesterase
MARDGDQAIRAETVLKAQTVPGHASMLAGVDTSKHLRTENEMTPILKKIQAKTIFDLVKMNGLKSAAYFGKEKLRFMFDTGAIDWNVSPRVWPFGDLWARWPGVVTSTINQIITRDHPDFLFIHYGVTDTIGHIFQWESAAQKAAVRAVDQSVGGILQTLEAKEPQGATRDYVVIFTADHGGHEGSHGHMTLGGSQDEKMNPKLEDVESDQVIPWIVYRSPQAIADDGRHVRLTNPKDVVNIYDTPATAASLLGLEVPKDWNWDGVNRVTLTK